MEGDVRRQGSQEKAFLTLETLDGKQTGRGWTRVLALVARRVAGPVVCKVTNLGGNPMKVATFVEGNHERT